MPVGLIFLFWVGAFVGFFVGATLAVIGAGWMGLLAWPGCAVAGALIGFAADMMSSRTGS